MKFDMQLDAHLPDAAFIDPTGANEQSVQQVVNEVMSLVVRFLGRAADVQPIPAWPDWLPESAAPEHGREMQAVLADLEKMLAQSMNPANPRFIGHMDTLPSTAGMLGEFVSAAINNNMLSVEMSPLLSRLEHSCLQHIASLFGLGSDAAGLMMSGGSLCNLQALAVARNDVLRCEKAGMRTLASAPVIFASRAAHTSIQKAAMVLGLGFDAVIPVDVDGDSRMRADALADAIGASRQRGDIPICVVATAGTTTSGSIDPLPQIARICREQAIWLHVDAAHGGALVFSDRHRDRLKGIEYADSITFNPQKWLYLPKTCAMLLFRDRARWQKAFRVGAPYMGSAGDLVNSAEVSLQGTRHADILKLWLSLQLFGKAGHGALIDHCMRLAERFADEIRKRSYLVLGSVPQTNLVCFRGALNRSAEEDAQWNKALQHHLNKENIAFFSLPQYGGLTWLRAVILNPFFEETALSAVFAAIDQFAARWPDAAPPNT